MNSNEKLASVQIKASVTGLQNWQNSGGVVRMKAQHNPDWSKSDGSKGAATQAAGQTTIEGQQPTGEISIPVDNPQAYEFFRELQGKNVYLRITTEAEDVSDPNAPKSGKQSTYTPANQSHVTPQTGSNVNVNK